MAKTKKVIALVLAFMMIFSSVSVLANAFNPVTDGGSTLTISAQILKNDGTEWAACDKVTAGEPVKVRVSLDTDYYSNGSALIFFYDNTFFSDSYATGVQPLTVNDSNFSDSEFTKSGTAVINRLLNAGCVTSDYLSTHNYFVVSLEGPFTNYQYDDSDWLFEFDLTVLANASGSGVFEVLDSTVMKTTNPDGYVNVPKGPQGGDPSNIYEMCDWFSGTVDCSVTVTTDSSITLNPAGGEWQDENTSVARTFSGTTGASFTRPELAYTGKTLAGWYDSSIASPVLTDLIYGPVGPTAYSADEDIELTAYWIDQVGATFSYNYDGAPADVVDSTATPGYPVGYDLNGNSIVPAVPTRDGYQFRGWSTDAAASPQATDLLQNFDGMVYGNESAAYYMIWAKAVTVDFYDTKAGQSLGSFSGYAGDPFTATAPTAPTYTGYTNVAGEGNFVPAAPSVFPDSDATYNAIYEANSYIVNYIIYSAQGSNDVVYTFSRDTAYGETVVTNIRYTAPGGKQLNADWYTDQACTTVFAGGALTSTSGLTLYTYLEDITYTVTFDLDGGNIGGDTSAVTTQVALMGVITAPADPVKDGYVFAGWSPNFTGNEVLDTPAARTYYATWDLDPDLKEFFYYEDGTAYETIDNVEGDAFVLPADPYKYGYSFAGWSATQGSDVVATTPSVMPDASTYYYAIFIPNTYDVTFDADGGEFADTTTVKAVASVFDSAIVLPADPTREGYTFRGWATTAGQTAGSTDLGNLTVETSEDEPLTYYAAWTIDSHNLTITYVVSDGKVEAPAQYTQSYEYNADYSVPSPAVTGYSPDEATVSGTMGTADVAVTVTYTPNDYPLNITYVMSDDNNAVKPADVVNQMVTFNTGYSVASPAVTGYTPDIATVSGTMDDVNGKSVTVTYTPNQYALSITYVMADSNNDVKPADVSTTYAYNTAYSVASPAVTGYTPSIATVSGTMDENGATYTVTYNPNEYTLTVIYAMSDGTTPPPAYVDEHVVFNTEYTVNSPAVTGYTPDIATVTGTMDENGYTTTVTYTPNPHTITWVLDGGSINDSTADIVQNVVFGNAIVAPGTPVKTGYTFSAWTPALAATVADENYTYTATYDANSYDAIFKLEGGNIGGNTADVVVPTDYDSAIVAPADPDRDGYTFQGWSTTAGGSVAAPGIMDDINGKTFYAVWTPDNASYFIDVYFMGTDGTYTTFQTYAGEDGKVTGDPVSVDPATYAQTGFTFDSANSTLNGTIPPTGELHLVVKFARDQHNLTFISENETVQAYTGVYYEVVTAAPTAADVSKTGYILDGWSSTDGGSVEVAPGADVTMGTTDLTYYAVWSPDQVTITVHEKYINVLNNQETVTDKTFTGTADAHAYIVETAGADASAKYILFSELDQTLATNYAIDPANANNVLDGAIAPDGSLELTVWYLPVNKTVTYDPNGGAFAAGTPGLDGANVVESFTFGTQGVPVSSVVPAREGYDFLGWDRSSSAVVASLHDGDSLPGRLNTDTVLYAVWSEYKTVTVNYEFADGTTAYTTFTHGYANGAEYSIPSPEIVGYTPDKAAVTGTMGDYSVTETVTYTPNQYALNITYVMSDGNNDVKPADVSTTYAYNTEYSVDSPTVTGYTPSIATVSGTMDENGYAVTVTYTPNPYTLTVTYVMSDNTTPPAAHTEQVTYNTAYSVTSPTVTGYTPNMAVVEGTMDAEGKEITVTYTLNAADLTINYIYTDGTTAAPTYTEELHYGDSYNVASPAITGYTPDKAAVTGTMGNDPVVETVIYTVNTYELRITYVMADGTTAPAEYVAQVAYNDAYSVASPAVPGYTPDQATVSGTMGLQAVAVTVTYTKDAVEVKFVIPERITGTTNYGKLNYPDAATVTGTEINVGEAITAPDADNILYYNFLGWTTTPITGVTAGNPDATLATIGNAEDNVVYYAVYEREAVYLVSRDDTKATVDRMGNNPGDWTNLYTEATFDSSLAVYKTQRSYSLWVVHHPAGLRITSRANPYTETYYDIHGDGEMVLTKSTYYTGNANIYGTGSKMTIKDKVTGETVEQFYIVIYGDVNGDNVINNSDIAETLNAINANGTWAKRNTYDPVKFMAANLAAPATFVVNNSDYAALYNVYNNSAVYKLDAATGVITEVQQQNP